MISSEAEGMGVYAYVCVCHRVLNRVSYPYIDSKPTGHDLPHLRAVAAHKHMHTPTLSIDSVTLINNCKVQGSGPDYRNMML